MAAAGRKVILGVRPEHLRPAEVGEISGEVMVVERLGGETFLYTQLAGASEMLVIQADGDQYRILSARDGAGAYRVERTRGKVVQTPISVSSDFQPLASLH